MSSASNEAIPAEMPPTPEPAAIGRTMMGGIQSPNRPVLDLREVIPAANANDPSAQAALVALTSWATHRALLRYPAADSENVLGEVLAQTLPSRFDPNRPLPEGTPPERIPDIVEARYRTYIARIVRSTVTLSLATTTRERSMGLAPGVDAEGNAVPTAVEEPYHENREVSSSLPDETVRSILTPRQYEIFTLRSQGSSYQEIVEQLDTTTGSVRNAIHRARRAIETHILEPAGIKPLAELSGNLYHYYIQHLYKGKIAALQILGTWYVHPDWLPKFEVSDETHVPLSAVASNATLQTFRRMYPDKIIKHRRLLYVRRDDLPLVESIETTKRAARKSHVVSPHPDYTLLSELGNNNNEQRILQKYLADQAFSDIIRVYGRIFVPTAEAEARLVEYRKQTQARKERRAQ